MQSAKPQLIPRPPDSQLPRTLVDERHLLAIRPRSQPVLAATRRLPDWEGTITAHLVLVADLDAGCAHDPPTERLGAIESLRELREGLERETGKVNIGGCMPSLVAGHEAGGLGRSGCADVGVLDERHARRRGGGEEVVGGAEADDAPADDDDVGLCLGWHGS